MNINKMDYIRLEQLLNIYALILALLSRCFRFFVWAFPWMVNHFYDLNGSSF